MQPAQWRTRRSSHHNFIEYQSRIDSHKFSFTPRIIKNWNDLADHSQHSRSHTFQNRDLIKDDGTKTQTHEEKADLLNNFSASVFTHEDMSNIPDPELRFDGVPLTDVKFDSEEVLKK